MFFKIRNSLNYAYFEHRTRSIHATPPIACDPQASCEVQTMLGLHDMALYLVAVKSLLRWAPGLAIVVHSDGSLDRNAFETLARHVPGVRLIQADEADRRAREMLSDRPALLRWRSFDAAYRRLIDTELWSTRPRRIIMDSDVLVLREPKEVMRWAESGHGAFLLGQPPDEIADDGPAPAPSAHVQAHFRHAVPALAKATGLLPRFLQGTTAGFHGCHDELGLDKVEMLLAACEAAGLRMTQWGGDQCLVIYLLSAAGAVRLDTTRCFNFDPSLVEASDSAEIIHFYGTYRFYRGVYPRLANEVCQALLGRSPRQTDSARDLPATGTASR